MVNSAGPTGGTNVATLITGVTGVGWTVATGATGVVCGATGTYQVAYNAAFTAGSTGEPTASPGVYYAWLTTTPIATGLNGVVPNSWSVWAWYATTDSWYLNTIGNTVILNLNAGDILSGMVSSGAPYNANNSAVTNYGGVSYPPPPTYNQAAASPFNISITRQA